MYVILLGSFRFVVGELEDSIIQFRKLTKKTIAITRSTRNNMPFRGIFLSSHDLFELIFILPRGYRF